MSVVTETKKSVPNIVFDYSSLQLYVRRTIYTYKVTRDNQNSIVSRKKVSSYIEENTYQLSEVSSRQLKSYRSAGKPGLVLKEENHLYYAPIPNLNLVSSTLLGRHKCSIYNCECAHLTAASDELGGCEKVRRHSTGIEKLHFIQLGYETFNCTFNCFVVIKCNHYKSNDDYIKLHL